MPPRSHSPRAAVFVGGLALAACAAPRPAASPDAPQYAKRVEARHGVVSSSSAEASAAGVEMLRRGGNAVDAAVATAFALAVVDPSQTGIGGYGSATIWLRGARRAEVIEAASLSGADPAFAQNPRDPAPRAGGTPNAAPNAPNAPATPAVSIDGGGRRQPRLALVPGFVAGLLTMHERHGKLPREVVMAPAVRLAREGFTIGPLLHRHIANARELLLSDPEAASVYYPNGEAIRPGERRVQRRLAEVLESIARGGARAFYEGELPRKVAAKVRAQGGLLDAADFAAYRAEVRRPVCTTYLNYTVLGVGSPMAAHVASEILNLADLAGVRRLGDFTSDSAAATRMADAVRIGLADRRSYHGNPDWEPTPVRGMASKAYAESRLSLVGAAVRDSLPTGDPWAFDGRPVVGACQRHDPYPASDAPPMRDARPARPGDGGGPNEWDGDDAPDTRSNTSHLSVIDADRNAVSITTSVGVLWGSGVYAEGFWLNSSGSLFDARERAPRRKPTGLTMPLLALEGDDVRLAVGAAGSAYIGAAVTQVTVRMLGLGQDPYAALAAPRFHVSPTTRTIEAEGGFAPSVYAGWRGHGYLPASRVADLQFAAVHAVLQRKDGTLVGAADPRRDGVALGY